MDKRLIDEDLLQLVMNYIGQGSVSKALTFAEVQIILQKLQGLPLAEQPEVEVMTPPANAKVKANGPGPSKAAD